MHNSVNSKVQTVIFLTLDTIWKEIGDACLRVRQVTSITEMKIWKWKMNGMMEE